MERRDWFKVIESTLKNTVRHSSRYQNTLNTILPSVDWVQLTPRKSCNNEETEFFPLFFSNAIMTKEKGCKPENYV